MPRRMAAKAMEPVIGPATQFLFGSLLGSGSVDTKIISLHLKIVDLDDLSIPVLVLLTTEAPGLNEEGVVADVMFLVGALYIVFLCVIGIVVT
jgi:hypothetical protein